MCMPFLIALVQDNVNIWFFLILCVMLLWYYFLPFEGGVTHLLSGFKFVWNAFNVNLPYKNTHYITTRCRLSHRKWRTTHDLGLIVYWWTWLVLEVRSLCSSPCRDKWLLHYFADVYFPSLCYLLKILVCFS